MTFDEVITMITFFSSVGALTCLILSLLAVIWVVRKVSDYIKFEIVYARRTRESQMRLSVTKAKMIKDARKIIADYAKRDSLKCDCRNMPQPPRGQGINQCLWCRSNVWLIDEDTQEKPIEWEEPNEQ